MLSPEYYGIMCAVPCGEREYPQERNENRKRKATEMNQLTATERQQLADAFDAIMGVASEYGPEFFDSYHKRKGDGLFGELEKIFIKLAPEEMKKVLG